MAYPWRIMVRHGYHVTGNIYLWRIWLMRHGYIYYLWRTWLMRHWYRFFGLNKKYAVVGRPERATNGGAARGRRGCTRVGRSGHIVEAWEEDLVGGRRISWAGDGAHRREEELIGGRWSQWRSHT